MDGSHTYEFDSEVFTLVDQINQRTGRRVASVITDTESRWNELSTALPRTSRRNTIDWNKAVSASGPLPNEPSETSEQIERRIAKDLDCMCKLATASGCDRVFFLSDDFYSIGIECDANVAPNVLTSWLPLPHAIFVASVNLAAALVVAFARSSYMFLGAVAEQGGQPEPPATRNLNS